MQITEDQLTQLGAHLAACQLGDLTEGAEQLLRNAAAGGAPVYSSTFLHTDSLLQWVLVQDATPAGDFALWLAAATGPVPLAQHFPQMLPASPWGIVDTAPYPFPHLAAVRLTDAQWTYRYISDPAKWGTAPFEAAPAGFTALTGPAGEHSGLGYTGKLALPWDRLLPAASGWAAAPTLAVDVSGYLDTRDMLPRLRLQAPLLSGKTLDFGAGRVTLDLRLEAVTELSPPPEMLTDFAGYRRRRSQIGLVGSVTIGSNSLLVSGLWPLDDDDDIVLDLECHLDKLSTWFGAGAVENLSLPPELIAGVQLLFSEGARHA